MIRDLNWEKYFCAGVTFYFVLIIMFSPVRVHIFVALFFFSLSTISVILLL